MRQPFVTLSVATAVSLALSAAPDLAFADVAGLVNAKLETRLATGGLEREVHALLATKAGPFWIGYAVPTRAENDACCWSSTDDVRGCRGCRLEGERGEGVFSADRKEPLPLEGSRRLRVLLRGEGNLVGRIRMASESCGLDAGGLPFVWLEGVRPADS